MKTKLSRKILLGVGLLMLISVSFFYGVYSVRSQNAAFKFYKLVDSQKDKLFADESDRPSTGIWHYVRGQEEASADDELEKKKQDAISKISTLAYLKGYNEAPDVDNVTIYDEQAAYPGVNYVLSANGPNAFIMDMYGSVLHKWEKEFTEVWPESYEINVPDVYRKYWRRAYLMDDGSLLAMFMNYGLLKLDKDSNLIWAFKKRVHHDVYEADSGNIFVLTREFVPRDSLDERLESWDTEYAVLEDFITELSPEGEEIRNISLVDCFLNSDYEPMLEHMKITVDILHANTIRPIPAGHEKDFPFFKEGNILVSMREIHTVAVIDPDAEKVVWATTGMWNYQHEPRLVDNSNILLFDNRGNFGKSKAVEFDPCTQEVVWTYRGSEEHPFYSREAGTLERLPNGNTLITESENGRAFEVTPEGEIVWEFFNPNRAGEENELIAALYDVIRIEEEKLPWLNLDSSTN